MWRRCIAAALVAGCNQLAGIHEIPIDARPDAGVDAPPLPVGPHYHFVIDHEYVPTNNAQAHSYGLDIDGDGMVDNQLGMVLGTLSSMGLDAQGATNSAVDDGSILMLADVQTTDFENATNTGFTTYYGANPQPPACNTGDTVCRHHLTGTGHFDVAPSSPSDAELVGTVVSGAFVLGPGHLGVQLGFIPGAPPLPLALLGARVRVFGVSATGITSGVLAGAVTATDINTTVIPAIQQGFIPLIAQDCTMLSNPPTCGCADGTQGKTLIGLFDTAPQDCMISVDEIRNNSIVQTLLAPDVTIEGQMALSFGVGITAVAATYTP